jgi:hypothetical protein
VRKKQQQQPLFNYNSKNDNIRELWTPLKVSGIAWLGIENCAKPAVATEDAVQTPDLFNERGVPVPAVPEDSPATVNEGSKNLQLKMELSDYFYAQRPGAKVSRNSK